MNNLFKIVMMISLIVISFSCRSQDNLRALHWIKGPSTVQLASVASLSLPKGYAFLEPPDSEKFLTLEQNIPTPDTYILVNEESNWFAIFSFNPIGFVKDDETIDASKIFESVKSGTESANEERKKRGWPTMSLVGWEFEPRYDRNNKRLEWAFLGKDDQTNQDVANFNTRILGRTGVMNIVLVDNPSKLNSSIEKLNDVLSSFSFDAGQQYSQYKPGDKVYKYGLAALILGGAAAVATQKGFWAILAGAMAAAWKAIAVAFAALVGWMRSLFRKKSGTKK